MKLDGLAMFGEGSVMHARRSIHSAGDNISSDVSHTFSYGIFNVLIPVQNEESVREVNRIFGISLSPKDYLDGSGPSLNQNIRKFLSENLGYVCDEIWLQTLPRMFGYVFNPVSFWYCHRHRRLDAVLCEVNNTFGERHFYFVSSSTDGKWVIVKLPKQFHVSPFFDVSGEYSFDFELSDELSIAKIKLWSGNHLKLDTNIRLQLKPLVDVKGFYIFKKYGWLTVLVIYRIHFQALRLWIKGAAYFRKPQNPDQKVTSSGVSNE